MRFPGRQRLRNALVLSLLALSTCAAWGQQPSDIQYVDQGPRWTHSARLQYYSQDEGSQLILLAWLRALRQPDGTPFLASVARYGFLPNPDPANTTGLPIRVHES